MKPILVVDDQPDIVLSVRFVLEPLGYKVHEASSMRGALEVLKSVEISVMLLDMNLSKDTTSGAEGLEILKEVRKAQEEVSVVVMTAWSSVDLAVRAMKLGAADFIEKPWENERLVQIIEAQLNLQELQFENRVLKQLQTSNTNKSTDFDSKSNAMQRTLEQIRKVAITDATVLLTGENGTGKSTLARQIHERSERSGKAFISVNMGAIPDGLFESEMFGHKKGAFTDAKQDRVGKFEAAKGGTLFLDEIANLTLEQQAKLLRVMESGEYERVGCNITRSTELRLVSATNADLQTLIRNGQFRQDLYFRLNTIELEVPSLRDRTEDIPHLLNYYLEKNNAKYNKVVKSVTPSAFQELLKYSWPGNIRELAHVVERAVLLGEGDVVETFNLAPAANLADSAAGKVQSLNISQRSQIKTIEESEIDLIQNALEVTEGNTSSAADLLGISISSLYRRMEKYAIKKA